MNKPTLDNIDINLSYKETDDLDQLYLNAYELAADREAQIISEGKAGSAYGCDETFDHYHVATSQLYFPRIVDYLRNNNYGNFERGIEIACGTTTLFDFIQVKHPQLLELATKHFQFMQKKGHHCFQGNIENTPFPDKESDITVACNILNVNYSYNRAISELKRITRDNGLIIIVVPWEQPLPRTSFSFSDSPTGLTLRTFNDGNFKSRFEDKGLKLIEKQFIPEQRNPNTIKVMNMIFKQEL